MLEEELVFFFLNIQQKNSIRKEEKQQKKIYKYIYIQKYFIINCKRNLIDSFI